MPVEKALQIGLKFFPGLSPSGLVDQILTRYDFSNRRFKDLEALLGALAEDISEEAFDIGDTAFSAGLNIFAQFKTVTTGTKGPFKVVKLTVKGGKNFEMLQKEVRLIEVLRLAGLRTAPVYGSVVGNQEQAFLFEKNIIGNFLDAKEGFSKRMNINLVSSFFGVEAPKGEAIFLAPIEKKVEQCIKLGKFPDPWAIQTAISDFQKIASFLQSQFIADLQGIVELRTGRFYIIDPLEIGPIAEAKFSEKQIVDFVHQIIGFLTLFAKEMERCRQLWFQKLREESMKKEIPTLPPPPGWKKK